MWRTLQRAAANFSSPVQNIIKTIIGWRQISSAYPTSPQGIRRGSSSDHQTITLRARAATRRSPDARPHPQPGPTTAAATEHRARCARRESTAPKSCAPVRMRSNRAPGNSLGCSPSPPASPTRSSAGGCRPWRHRRPVRVAGDRAAHGIDRGSNAVHGPDKVCLDSFPPILELIVDMGGRRCVI